MLRIICSLSLRDHIDCVSPAICILNLIATSCWITTIGFHFDNLLLFSSQKKIYDFFKSHLIGLSQFTILVINFSNQYCYIIICSFVYDLMLMDLITSVGSCNSVIFHCGLCSRKGKEIPF